MEKVCVDSIIGDILMMHKETADILAEAGMHCKECPSAMGETVAQACAVHGVSAQDLVGRINDFLSRQDLLK